MPTHSDFLFLPISGPRGASSRYRVYQFLPTVSAAGWRYTVHVPPPAPRAGVRRMIQGLKERWQIAEMAKSARAICIQKRLLPESLIASLSHGRPLLFDFDDAIFTTPNGDRSGMAQRRVEGRLKETLSTASIVVAGNNYLRDYAEQYSKHVTVLPTVVDTSRYPAKDHLSTEEIVIGWIGHSVNHPYLAALSEVLSDLARHFRIRLLVVSDRDLTIPGVAVDNRRWSETSEVKDILEMDIGIMPMPDDPWSRGKCGLKAIQYMAAGIPAVCASVGANNEIIRDEVDGFTVATQEGWKNGLAHLCSSIESRIQMGANARARAINAYSLCNAAPLFLKQIEALLN